MYRRIREFIQKFKMIERGDTVVAGVSGGGDSMAMLSLLLQYREEIPFSLRVVHVHHGIRGAEADRDRDFVKKYCEDRGISCAVHHYDVPGLARQWGMGTEEAGRIVRRRAFAEEAADPPAQTRIALAHHRDDLAETMLHNLARGTGIRGLTGIAAVQDGVIRPLLCLEKREIALYLREKSVPFLEDSTNLEDQYTRNRIRHHVLPALEEVNSRAVAHMAETAQVLCQAQEYLEEQSRILLKKCRKASGSFFFSEDFFGQAVILKEYGILLAMEELSGQRKDLSAVHVRQVLELWEKQTGRRIALPYGLEAVRGYGGVYLRKGETGQGGEKESHESKRRSCVRKSGENSWFLPVPGELKCPLGTFRTEIFSWKNQKIEEKKYTKWLDYDKIEGSLNIRTRKEGDYMAADREGRHKKLTRVMIDRKIPGEERDHIPLVAAGQEILWIAGDRMNDRYRITGDTRRVLQVQYTKEDLRQ